MLDRLNLATRGKRGGGGTIAPAGGVVDSSQRWNLDMLGNWAGDPGAGTPVPGFIRDVNGDGTLEIERVRYDPYGNAQQMYPGDFNGNGQVSVQDLFDFLAVYNAAAPRPLMADFNRDGGVGVSDLNDFLAFYFTPGPDAAEGGISSADYANGGTDNVIGYCGYIHNPETGDYTVRFRTYMPGLGRWGERDPAGYVDGYQLYLFGRSDPTSKANDPLGLEPIDKRTREQKKADICKAIQDAADNNMSLDDFLKKYATTWGTDAGVFYQSHGEFGGKPIDVDWLLTLLYANRFGTPNTESLTRGASLWWLYHIGKAYWHVKDSIDSENRSIWDFFDSYRQQEELDAIDLGNAILDGKKDILEVLAKIFGCESCPSAGKRPTPTPRAPGSSDREREAKRQNDEQVRQNKDMEDRNEKRKNDAEDRKPRRNAR